MNKVMIGGGVLAIVALGGGAYRYKFSPSHAGHVQKAPAPEPTPKLAYVDVKEMTMRLADSTVEHYIKITPVLAVQAKDADDVTDRLAVVRDRIIGVVTAHPSTDIVTPQGQAMLKRSVADALKDGFHDEIVDIYFSGYLVE